MIDGGAFSFRWVSSKRQPIIGDCQGKSALRIGADSQFHGNLGPPFETVAGNKKETETERKCKPNIE